MEIENTHEAAAMELEEGRADGPRWGQMEQEVRAQLKKQRRGAIPRTLTVGIGRCEGFRWFAHVALT